jgi:hypothetical protein
MFVFRTQRMTIRYTFTQGEFEGLTGSMNEQTLVPMAGCQ